MSKASLDTNVLLRATLKDIPEQFERAKALLSTPGTTFLVSDIAVAEYVYALEDHYHLAREQVAEMVRGIILLPNVRLDESRFAAVLDEWVSHPKLSFEDCCLAESARAAEATPLWTFDKKLAKQHGAAAEVPQLR
ncbi:MAG: PIN domain-containing protein [Propionibacteriaceae bacterium]|nr:PIN domain-containing protein [Propionibacteriaceae bacterium]